MHICSILLHSQSSFICTNTDAFLSNRINGFRFIQGQHLYSAAGVELKRYNWGFMLLMPHTNGLRTKYET